MFLLAFRVKTISRRESWFFWIFLWSLYRRGRLRSSGWLGEGSSIPELDDSEVESDPTLPSTEDVIRKTEQITKNIQELLRAAQENKHDRSETEKIFIRLSFTYFFFSFPFLHFKFKFLLHSWTWFCSLQLYLFPIISSFLSAISLFPLILLHSALLLYSGVMVSPPLTIYTDHVSVKVCVGSGTV